MTKLWFKAKRYGWGWTPSSWQGWALILLYVLIVTLAAINIEKVSTSGSAPSIRLFIPILVATVVLILICYRTGEKPGWRCGDKKQD